MYFFEIENRLLPEFIPLKNPLSFPKEGFHTKYYTFLELVPYPQGDVKIDVISIISKTKFRPEIQ